jgi:energy-coupling factor transporter ATP-binding protein EcfA2
MAIPASLKYIDILGLRGFATNQRLELAIPNGRVGSGLTIVVGQNNAGKSTITEAFAAVAGRPNIVRHFSEGKRNKAAGDKVSIALTFSSGYQRSINTVEFGGSETRIASSSSAYEPHIMVLPSRRFFNPFFSADPLPRANYIFALAEGSERSQPVNHFTRRLINIQTHNKTAFNSVLSQLVNPPPEFIIERTDAGTDYLKIRLPNYDSHSSQGLGEGLISLMFIADALYDAPVGSLLVIDEPELSLHPAILRRLSHLFSEFAKDRQIVLATHSPYFADLSYIAAGARLARVHIAKSGCCISHLSASAGEKLQGLLANRSFPHVLGLDAREIFFQDDGVILVEGQDDVVGYRRIAEQLNTAFKGSFFGWGVGGFGNFRLCAQILTELGFKRVVGILDGDHHEIANRLQNEFSMYRFFVIPAPDVRTKASSPAKPGKEGLLDTAGKFQSQFQQQITQMISDANNFLTSTGS